MSPFETVFIWTAIFLYAVTTALFIYSFVFKNERVLNRISWFIGVAFLFHTAAIVARLLALGNLPTASPHENSMGTAWCIVLFTLYVSVRHRSLKVVGIATLPFSLLMLGYGVMSGPELVPMSASVRSFWLYIHVFFAWIAFGAYAIAFGLSILYLRKDKMPEKEFYKRLPDLQRLEDFMFKYLIFGFITDAVMIASGAIWAKDLWGNYWSWDPVETWSLITWLIYGLAIHLRVTMGWRGRRFAWILIIALAGMIITYFGINIVVKTSLHVFEVWQEL
jgi:cytochrome c-type biogenesis protein CcsB